MSYCTVQDLEAYYLNKSFKCGDYLTNGKATSFIAQDAVLIDSIIKTRYATPITGTNDLILLKMINEWLVVGTIDDIFREKTEDGKFERGRNTRKDGMDFLKKIRDGEMVLEATEHASVMKFNITDSNGDDVEKRFKAANIEPSASSVDLENRQT